MAKQTFRSGGELDDEDSIASRAAGIREGQIIQTHNAIQEALARAETAAAQSDPVIPPGIFPDHRPGKGNYDPELFSANEALQDAISDREAVEGPDPRGAKRRPGFAPIAPQEIADEAAAGEVPQADAGSAAVAGGAGLALAGGVGAVAALAAQQAMEAAQSGRQLISAPGGGKTIANQENDLGELLEVQKKVAKVGLPTFGGAKTQAQGSRL